VRLAYRIGATAGVLFCLSCSPKAGPNVPNGYPASYAKQIDAAEREGELDILSATPRRKASGVIAAFRRLYPAIKLVFVEKSAQQVYDMVTRQAAAGHGSADLVWSAAMDLQMKLVNDGLTQRYVSPERRPHFPRWANWKNQAWAITAEPVVFIYNRRFISDPEVPKDHAQLRTFLERHVAPTRFRLASYSVAHSAVGYLYFSQDQQASHEFWRLVRDFGANGAVFYPDAEDIVAAVADGRASLGYDIIGSYALDVIKRNRRIGMVVPRDYALALSRIVVIPAAARHPNAAKLFLDLMLSSKGQSEFADEGMPPIRDDIADPSGLDLRHAPLRAIRVGPGLLITQDRLTREHFLRRWYSQLRAGAAAGRQAQLRCGSPPAASDSTMTGVCQ
jgi:iron(III) transport system substrate-binding protein